MYSPIFVWYYQYYIVFTNICVILPLLHFIHQYSCDTTTITLYSPIFVWYYHYYIAFTNMCVILTLLHCVHQYSCDASIIISCYCDVPEFTPSLFWGVRVTWSLVLYLCFVDRCLYFSTFSFGHCVVCYSWIYGLWLLLWYLQTPLYSIRH